MIGQYFPGNSVLHRLDARVKLALMAALMVGVFFCDNGASYGLFILLAVILTKVSGVSTRVVLRSLMPLRWIVLLTFLIHLFSAPGEKIFEFYMLSATEEGFWRGLFIGFRLMLLILFSSLLTFTTEPMVLTDALQYLMSPLKKIGVPAAEIAMMMTVALRFVPTLINEADKIIKAQKSRGADFEEGSLLTRIKNLTPILVPLFISCFRRADELALAMEARCYTGEKERTHLKELKTTAIDAKAAAMAAAFLGVVFWMQQ